MKNTTTKKVIKCTRCGRRYRGHGDWNIVFTHGVTTGYLCPDDQTVMENIEAVVNEATGASRIGRLVHPGDADYPTAQALHLIGVRDDVWDDWLTTIGSGEAATFDPYALADETLRRVKTTIGTPKDESVREQLAQDFRDMDRSALGRED